jgi:1-acyl-sn-glycerol-3-phosphate acyltransferase
MIFWRATRTLVLSLCLVVFRVRVYHRDRVPGDGAYVVAPSHRSILDIPFTAFVTPRRIRFLAKQELFQPRIGRWLFPRLGGIAVERGTTDRAALRTSEAVLAEGEPLAIFPEGTRREGPELGDLFHGCAYLALRQGVPIVPVGIGGSEEILPRGRVIPRPRRVVVVVGEPVVAPDGASSRRRSDVTALSDTLRDRLQEVFAEARTRAGTAAALPGEVDERA